MLRREFWQHRHLLFLLISREIQARYRSSFLGLAWSLLVPLSTIIVYTFAFSVVIKSTWATSSSIPYAIILFAGLIPFNLFSEMINQSPTLILRNPNYVKKVVFPLHLLPFVILGTVVFDSLIGLGIIFLSILFVLKTLPVTVLLLPFVYLPLLLILLGLSWFLSSLGVFIRDVGPAVNIMMRLWFFLTPIVYPLTIVPDRYQFFIKLNPMTFITNSFQNLLLWGQPLAWNEWVIWMIVGIIVCILGYVWFVKTRKGFADVI